MHHLDLVFQAREFRVDILDHEFDDGGAIGGRLRAAFLEERHRFGASDGERGRRRDDLGEHGRKPFGALARHHLIEADHRLDVGGDEACGCEFHELSPFDPAAKLLRRRKGLVAQAC